MKERSIRYIIPFTILFLFCIMSGLIIISSVKIKQANITIAALENHLTDNQNKCLYLLNKKLSDFICIDTDNNKILFSNITQTPSIILLLSEDFCPDCIETILSTYKASCFNSPKLYIVFEKLTARELSFRQEIFNDIACLSASSHFEEQELSPQTLLYVDQDSFILNVLPTFYENDTTYYNIFFSNVSAHFNND